MTKSKLAITSFVLGILSSFPVVLFSLIMILGADSPLSLILISIILPFIYLGLLSLSIFTFPMGSIIFGFIALNYIKKFKLEGRRLAITGIILGFLTLLAIAIYFYVIFFVYHWDGSF